MKFLKQYYFLLVPLLFLAGLIIPFTGSWISGIFYFFLSSLSVFIFFIDFHVSYLKDINILFAQSIPILTFLAIIIVAISTFKISKTLKWLSGFLFALNVIAYLCYGYCTFEDIQTHTFTATFFNETLWFISSSIGFISVFYSYIPTNIIRKLV